MADVVPHIVKADDVPWQMLSPYDMWQMVNHRGRCYNLLLSNVADVIAIMLCVADGKPTKLHVTTFANFNGRCYCQGGRWNSLQRQDLAEQVADLIAMVADGIATKGQFLF